MQVSDSNIDQIEKLSGFKSGDEGDHSSFVQELFCPKFSFKICWVAFEVWARAPFCMKMKSPGSYLSQIHINIGINIWVW